MSDVQDPLLPPRSRHRIAVVCRSRQQFRDWCYDNDRVPNDPSLYLVLELHHVRGRWFDEVVLVDGSAWLMEAARSRLCVDNKYEEQR